MIPGTTIIQLRKKKATETKGILYLRVSVGGKPPYVYSSLSYSIPEIFWDAAEQRVKKGYPDNEDINLKITMAKVEVQESIKTMGRSGFEVNHMSVSKLFLQKGTHDVLEYYRTHLKDIQSPRKDRNGKETKFSPNHIKKIKSEYTRLKTYTGGTLLFSQIDKKWMEAYEEKYAPDLERDTSLPTMMVKLGALLRKAEGDGLFSMQQIKGYKFPPYRNPERPYLNIDQIDRILKKTLDGDYDSDVMLRSVACYFLVECCCGIRLSDWKRFKVEKLIDTEAVKVRAKKNGQPVYFPITNSPRLRSIVDYIRSHEVILPDTEQHANRLLKIIGGPLELSFALTTHVGRHTAATMLLELGYSDAGVAEVLGVSIRTVAIYAKVTRRKLTNEYEKYGGI